MGCAQSTVKDQVHDTTPATDAAVTASAVPASPAAADAAVTSAPPSSDLVFHAADEPAAPVATEEAAAAPVTTEEAAATPAAEPVVEEAAVATAPVSAAPKSTASVAPPPASTTSAAATHEVADAVVDEVVAAAVDTPAATEEATVEPETEVAPAAIAATDDEAPATGLVFTSAGVNTNDKGVAFYNYTASNAADPAQDTKISKRFNDFKALHAEVAALMANEANVAAEHQDKFKTYPALPALPKTSLFRGRSNTKQTEERDAQFLKILNAIARHPIAVESPQFKAFLA